MPRDVPPTATQKLDCTGGRLDVMDADRGGIGRAAFSRIERGGPQVQGCPEHVHVLGKGNRIRPGALPCPPVLPGIEKVHDAEEQIQAVCELLPIAHKVDAQHPGAVEAVDDGGVEIAAWIE